MPARKRVRLVVDVNVLVSTLITGDRAFIRALFNKQRFTLLSCPELEREFGNVVHRPRMRRYFTQEEADRMVHGLISLSARLDEDPPTKAVSRDPKDDYLLATAKAGKADLLITGDEDLLVLKKHGRTRIIRPADFRKKHILLSGSSPKP